MLSNYNNYNNGDKRQRCGGVSAFRQRGFLHVLLLVFVVLGISMWGVSELYQRSIEQEKTAQQKSDSNLEAAKRALLDYAIILPRRVESRTQPGRFNVYTQNIENRIPFRRFALPCPDVTGDDNNLDGVSDVLADRCLPDGDTTRLENTTPLASGSRFGRLPWRNFDEAEAGEYTFVRGVGGRDFRDSSGNRFWYVVSENVVSGNIGNVNVPLNPHALLRKTTNWLSVVDTDGALLSDRVVAAVIAPGLSGGFNTPNRIEEDLIYTIGETPATITDNNFHRGYLSSVTYNNIANNILVINTTSDDSDTDEVEYLSIDDLAAANGAGIELLEESGRQNIYDIANGDNEFLGVTGLLEEHLNRFGFLPAPAVFDDRVVTVANRPSGVPIQMNVAVNGIVLPMQQQARVNVATAVSVELRLADMPPIYLGAGLGLIRPGGVDEGIIHPPYNIALANLDTALNSALLSLAVTTALVAEGHYPTNGLFGLTDLDGYVANDVNVRMTIRAVAPLPVTLNSGVQFLAVLADDAYGYFRASVLTDFVSYASSTDTDSIAAIAKLPPSALKALLPAGTPILLPSGDAGIVLNLPAGYEFLGTFNEATRLWELSFPPDNAVQISPVQAGSLANAVITVGMPTGLPMIAGESGILPIESVSAMITVISDDEDITLPAQRNAISDLAVDMVVYSTNDLTIVPFPPPGRPVIGGNSRALPTPLLLPGNSEFVLPSGSRLIYPLASTIAIGEDFRIPDNTLAELAAGTKLTLRLLPRAVLPGGVALGNSAAVTQLVTLRYGGLMPMRGARPILEGPNVIAARQNLFDIEMRGAAMRNNGGVRTPLSAGRVVQPFTGRMLRPAPVITLQAGDMLRSASRVRAGFLVSPRRAVFPDAGTATATATPLIVTINSVRALSLPNTKTIIPVNLTLTLDEDTEFVLPPNFAIPITRAELSTPTRITSVMQTVILEPETSIFDPDHLSELLAITLVGGGRPNLILLDEPLLLPLAQKIVAGSDVRGITENRLALYPDSDMYVDRGGTPILIPAGSIVDLMAGEVHQPVGVQRTRRVADDLQIRSTGDARMYFNRGVTLRTDLPRLLTKETASGLQVQSIPPPATVVVRSIRYDASGAATTVMLTINTRIGVPAGSYITIPAGRAIDFLSNNVAALNATRENSDYAHLPAQSALVILPGATLVIDGGATNIIGPAYVGLGSDLGSAALVNHPSHTGGEPLIFLSDTSYLRDAQAKGDLREELYVSIAKQARLDIYGNMEKRSDSGFYGDLMPIDSAQFFTDFPMIYAVAPECRQDTSLGVNCGEGEKEGLMVELEEGSEYLLKEKLVAERSVLLTSNLVGVGLSIISGRFGSLPMLTVTADSLLIGSDGMVTLPPGVGYVPQVNERLVVRVEDSLNPRNSELRSYFGVTVFNAPLTGLHYAAVDGALTVYVGGYVNGVGNAAGVVALSPGTTLNLGAGTQLVGGKSGEQFFGPDSSARLDLGSYNAIVNLSDYAVVEATLFNLNLTLSAEANYVGLYNQFFEPVNTAISVSSFIVVQDSSLNPPIMVREDTSIDMQPGYLWQGYIPAGGDGSAVTIAFSRNENLVTTYTSPSGRQWPPAAAYIRVPSTVTVLNTWGSGLERPEGLDGESTAANTLPLLDFGMFVSTEGERGTVPVITVVMTTTIERDGRITMTNVEKVFTRPPLTITIGEVISFGTITVEIKVTTFEPGSITVFMTTRIATTATMTLTLVAGGLPVVVELITTMTLTTPRITTDILRIEHTHAYGTVAHADGELTLSVIVHGPGGASPQAALWRPVAVDLIDDTTRYESVFRWNYKNHPFGVSIRIATDRRAGPAGRSVEGSRVDAAGARSGVWGGQNITMPRSAPRNPLDSGYLNNLMCGTEPVTVAFNPPNFLMTPDHRPRQLSVTDVDDGFDTNAAVRVAWEHPNENVQANMVVRLSLAELAIFGGTDGLERPPYVLATAQPSYHLETTSRPTSSDFPDGGTPINLTTHTDMVFYLDRAYNPHSGVPMQKLFFGNRFQLSGPGALVPPFGGKNRLAVAETYAERSNIMSKVFGYPALHNLYDNKVAGTNPPASFNNADWFPIVGGVVAFDSVNVSVQTDINADINEQVRLVMPQPEMVVTDITGNPRTIYAGSIIYPRRRLIVPAIRLPEGTWELRINESAQAAVDVSPAISPRPKRLFRAPEGRLLRGDFNYAPIRVTTTSGEICIIEPLHFQQEEIIDFNPETADRYDIRSNLILRYSGTGVDDVLRYDGTFSRGVLADADGVRIVTTYLGGGDIFALPAAPTTATISVRPIPILPITDYPVTTTLAFTAELHGVTAAIALFPVTLSPTSLAEFLLNTDVELGNPLAFRWQHSANHFLRLGIARQNFLRDPTDVRDNPFDEPFTGVGVNITTTAQEFRSLRLAHRIEIPETTLMITVNRSDNSPTAASNVFRFPNGSTVHVLNNDYSSWLAAHPYLARYRQGLEFQSAANTLTIASGNNAGYASYDISGQHVLHYRRSESAPAEEPFSAAPVYTNVWLRLDAGGILRQTAGGSNNDIVLPPGALFNPIMGTYLLHQDPGGGIPLRAETLFNNYLTDAVVNSALRIARPALTIPAGARLVAGTRGGFIRNVKALAIFSLTPLSIARCATGVFGVRNGQQGTPVQIDQMREGLSEQLYEDVTTQPIGLGHPCMWADDPENTDGDRFFLYRGRRRYVDNSLQAITASNDRTYLLGGKLELRF